MKLHSFSSIDKRPTVDACICCFAKGEKGEVVPLFQSPQLESATRLPIQHADFVAKAGSFVSVYPENFVEKRIILLGLGSLKELSPQVVRESFSKLFHSFVKKLMITVSIIPPEGASELFYPVLEGVFLGSYRFNRYTKDTITPAPEEVFVHCDQMHHFPDIEKEISAVFGAVYKTQDLVNMNADEATPEGIVKEVVSWAGTDLQIRIHDEDWIASQKMGLIQAVSQGSAHPPRFVVIRYEGNPELSDRTVLIGKGITFDTGGLNLKTGDFMQHMKGDMAGAAAVIGAMLAISSLKIPANVTAVLPLCENSIGSRAYKPGDVVLSKKGISVEIANTDAEGRLILADALTYAVLHEKPSRIVDLATLTGAAEVALGAQISAMFSNSDALAFSFEKAASTAGEKIWRLPLHLPYEELLQSEIADCKNLGGRSGGAINAAVFLHKFVENIPWVHFDIAGTAFTKEPHTCFGKGATGVMVRTLVQFVREMVR